MSSPNQQLEFTKRIPSAPVVFLSSVFTDFFDEQKIYVPLRAEIIARQAEFPINLWAYDEIWKKGGESPVPSTDTVLERCYQGVRDCDLFVFIASNRHGAPLPYSAEELRASFLELELLLASLLQKPILVLELRGREPEQALHEALVFFRTSSSAFYCLGDQPTLFERFIEACRALARGDLVASPAQRLFVDYLSEHRTRQSSLLDIESPPLTFLDRGFLKRCSSPDLAQINELLAQLSGDLDTPESPRRMTHSAALFRVRAAMRQMLGDEEQSPLDPVAASYWDRCLGLWAGKASWMGLHAHAWMSPLAAVNAQSLLRKNFASDTLFSAATDTRLPEGPRASAIYSVAGRVRGRERKIYHYEQAVLLATRAIETGSSSEEGARSIRGHATLQMARLGRFGLLWDARADFARSLELRIRNSGESSRSAGQGMVDLGFCRVLMRDTRRGYEQIERGLAGLRSATSADDLSFLMRGLRQYELASKLTGRVSKARKARAELLELQPKTDALDQLR